MPAAMKRPSIAPRDAAKRRKSETTEVKDVKVDKVILAALAKRKMGAEALPADVISMLSAMLPLAVGKEPGRHSNQEKLLDFVFKELKVVESGLLAEVAEQQQVVDGSDQERARRMAAEAAAATALEPKKGAAAAAKQRQDATAAAATEARAKLQDAQDAAQAGDVAAAAADTKLEQLKLALETKARLEHPEPPPAEAMAQEPRSPGQPPQSPATAPKSAATSPGRKSPAKLRSEAAALSKQLQGLFDDESLLDATKVSLSKSPEDRGEFDERVLQQLHVALSDALEAQTKASQALADGKANRQSNLETLTAAKDQALEAAADEEMAASDAEAASDEAEGALKAAQKDVASFELELQAAREKVAKADAKVAEYRAGALAAFDALRNPPAPQPEVVDAANEEESAVVGEPEAVAA